MVELRKQGHEEANDVVMQMDVDTRSLRPRAIPTSCLQRLRNLPQLPESIEHATGQKFTMQEAR